MTNGAWHAICVLKIDDQKSQRPCREDESTTTAAGRQKAMNDAYEILIILALIPLMIAAMHTLLEPSQPQPAGKRREK